MHSLNVALGLVTHVWGRRDTTQPRSQGPLSTSIDLVILLHLCPDYDRYGVVVKIQQNLYITMFLI